MTHTLKDELHDQCGFCRNHISDSLAGSYWSHGSPHAVCSTCVETLLATPRAPSPCAWCGEHYSKAAGAFHIARGQYSVVVLKLCPECLLKFDECLDHPDKPFPDYHASSCRTVPEQWKANIHLVLGLVEDDVRSGDAALLLEHVSALRRALRSSGVLPENSQQAASEAVSFEFDKLFARDVQDEDGQQDTE